MIEATATLLARNRLGLRPFLGPSVRVVRLELRDGVILLVVSSPHLGRDTRLQPPRRRREPRQSVGLAVFPGHALLGRRCLPLRFRVPAWGREIVLGVQLRVVPAIMALQRTRHASRLPVLLERIPIPSALLPQIAIRMIEATATLLARNRLGLRPFLGPSVRVVRLELRDGVILLVVSSPHLGRDTRVLPTCLPIARIVRPEVLQRVGLVVLGHALLGRRCLPLPVGFAAVPVKRLERSLVVQLPIVPAVVSLHAP